MSFQNKSTKLDATPNDPNDRYEEFLTLFSADRERLAAYIYSLLPNQADAEDVFQRVSLLLWRKFSTFEPDRSFLSWGCGIAFYEVRNFLRSSHRTRMQFNSDLMTTLADERIHNIESGVDLLPVLQGCLGSLPKSHRELVRAAYEEGQSMKSYAESAGLALQTVYNRLSRVRRLLLDCIQRKAGAELS